LQDAAKRSAAARHLEPQLTMLDVNGQHLAVQVGRVACALAADDERDPAPRDRTSGAHARVPRAIHRGLGTRDVGAQTARANVSTIGRIMAVSGAGER
jgi:hypothetical protein